MTVADLRPAGFAHTLGTHGDRVAIRSADGDLGYHELDSRVRAVEARLGTRRRLVHLRVANRVESIVAYLAALRAGHPILFTAPGDATVGAAYDPDVVIDAHDGEIVIQQHRTTSAHELHPDLALLLSTSGSTGSPKLVRLSHANLDANASAIAEMLGIRATDRAMTSLPLHYCYGLSVLNSHLARGAGIVLTEHSVIDRCFWDVFGRHGATTFAGVPHTFDLLDRIGFEDMDLPSLRYVTQAGGRLAPEKVERFAALGRRRGWDLVVMYGQTEATARMAYLPPHLAESHPSAIGIPIPGGAFEIEPAGDDEHGELVYRGPNVMLGYATTPADLALGATLDELRTGDLARQTDHGVFEIVGRRSRFVKLFGLRVGLDDVESRLAARGITAMCGGDDEHLVVAVADELVPDDAVLAACAEVGVPPARVQLLRLSELPRLTSGKPDHAALARVARADARADVRHESVAAIYADILRCDVDGDDSFVSLGGDSLSYVELSIQLEDALGHLPTDWYLTRIRDLRPTPAPTGRRIRRIETNVAMRAAAIALIVATHARLAHVPGSAHVLLAVAGFNFGRFQLGAGPSLRSVARIAVPAMCWIGVVAAVSTDFDLVHALLLHGLLGDADGRWAYWFVEALVLMLLGVWAALALPRVRALEQRWPFGFALFVLVAGVAVRFDLLPLPDADHRIYRPHEVLWLFALGWAIAAATTWRHRALVSAVVIAAAPGFFGDPRRELVVIGGVLLLAWLPHVPVPVPLNRIAGSVAGASLVIYLTHWETYRPLRAVGGPLFAVVGALAIGVLATVALDAVQRRAVTMISSLVASIGRRSQPPYLDSTANPAAASATTSASSSRNRRRPSSTCGCGHHRPASVSVSVTTSSCTSSTS